MWQKVHIWQDGLRAELPQIAPSPPRLPTYKKGQNLGFSASLTPIWENTVENITIYFQEPFYGNHRSFFFPEDPQESHTSALDSLEELV